MPVLPGGFVGGAEGYFSVMRTLSVGTTWVDIDVRAPAFSGEADVNAMLVAEGFTVTDLQERGLLRSLRVMSLHATQDAYVTEVGTVGESTVNPTTAYMTAPARGPGVVRVYTGARQRRKAQVRGAGAATILNVEISFDIPPAE